MLSSLNSLEGISNNRCSYILEYLLKEGWIKKALTYDKPGGICFAANLAFHFTKLFNSEEEYYFFRDWLLMNKWITDYSVGNDYWWPLVGDKSFEGRKNYVLRVIELVDKENSK